MTQPDRSTARRLAQESLAKGDATGWFDRLYTAAAGDPAIIPWADLRMNPNLAAWISGQRLQGNARRCLVVGCGLGDDAEGLASLGYQTTAFDISANAIDWCRRRFSPSAVDYRVADLLNPHHAWRAAYDLVVEIFTLQALPPELRHQAIGQLAGFVAPGGTLLVIARGRDEHDEHATIPWPLTKTDIGLLSDHGLEIVTFEDYLDAEEPPVRRFRVELQRLASG